jgi:hypothetical protein
MNFVELDQGIKYLSFNLKPNDYRYENWMWLYNKIEERISFGVIDGYQGEVELNCLRQCWKVFMFIGCPLFIFLKGFLQK